jgi:hypothetical protein
MAIVDVGYDIWEEAPKGTAKGTGPMLASSRQQAACSKK